MTTKSSTNHALEHVRRFHQHALAFGTGGKLVLTQMSPKGGSRSPLALHIPLTGDGFDQAAVEAFLARPGVNIYMALSAMRGDLPEGKKGSEADVNVVFGLCADFDDADAPNWQSRVPVSPSMVLETSPGRFQAFFMFDQPLSMQEAKALGEALQAHAECDFVTKDMSHVWRIPGTSNHPTAEKVERGRSASPIPVKTVIDWKDDAKVQVGDLFKQLRLTAPKAEVAPTKSAPEAIDASRMIDRLPARVRGELHQPARVGERSEAFYRLVGMLRAEGLSPDEITAVLQKFPNGPAAKYIQENRLGAQVRHSFDKQVASDQKSNAAKTLIEAQPRTKFRLYRVSELAEIPPAEWRIEDLLHKNSLALVYGLPNTGKTFCVLSMGLSVATGMDWFGRKVEQGPVVYIAGEGSSDLRFRIAAWEEANQTKVPDEAFLTLDAALPVPDEGQIAEFIAQVRSERVQPALIILDTLARCSNGMDENTANAMGQFVIGADELRRAWPGCTVLIVHHSTKVGDTPRGSGALTGAVSTEIKIAGDGPKMTLTCGKQKAAKAFEPIYGCLQGLKLPDGLKDSCVFVLDESGRNEVAKLRAMAERGPSGELSESAKQLLRAIREAGGELSTSEWEGLTKLKGSTFKDARKKLERAGLVEQSRKGRWRLKDEGRAEDGQPDEKTASAA